MGVGNEKPYHERFVMLSNIKNIVFSTQTARIMNVTFLNGRKLQKLKIIPILWQKCSLLKILIDGLVVNCHMVPVSQTGSQIYILWQKMLTGCDKSLVKMSLSEKYPICCCNSCKKRVKRFACLTGNKSHMRVIKEKLHHYLGLLCSLLTNPNSCL